MKNELIYGSCFILFIVALAYACVGSWPAAMIAVVAIAAYIGYLVLLEVQRQFDRKNPEVVEPGFQMLQDIELIKKDISSLRAQQQLRLLRPGMRE